MHGRSIGCYSTRPGSVRKGGNVLWGRPSVLCDQRRGYVLSWLGSDLGPLLLSESTISDDPAPKSPAALMGGVVFFSRLLSVAPIMTLDLGPFRVRTNRQRHAAGVPSSRPAGVKQRLNWNLPGSGALRYQHEKKPN